MTETENASGDNPAVAASKAVRFLWRDKDWTERVSSVLEPYADDRDDDLLRAVLKVAVGLASLAERTAGAEAVEEVFDRFARTPAMPDD